MKIVIVGHVDHGKSTLIGRLLHDSGSLPEGRVEQLRQAAARRRVPFEWANLMDSLQAERDQNISIETTQIWFHSAVREYVIIDAPGHKEFLKNMVTGAASADAALLLVDAHEGIQENSRRHAYLLHLLGIRQLVVLVNKMDLVRYDQEVHARIVSEYSQWLRSVGLVSLAFIPISAKEGDNLTSHSPSLPWWTGPTVMEALDSLKPHLAPESLPLRFVVQDVYRFDARRIIAGRIEAGSLKTGDRVFFSPGGKSSEVKSIERWASAPNSTAEAGESIGITLTEQIFVERGAIGAHVESPPYELTRLKARLFWMGRRPLQLRSPYRIKLAAQEAECEIERIERVLDASTLATVGTPGAVSKVDRHEVGEVIIRTRKPVAFDLAEEIVATGRFVIVDGLDVAGGGIVIPDAYPRIRHDTQQKSEHIYWTHGKVTTQQREIRNGHPGCILWLTGLSASGKSTIATELERQLFNRGNQVCVLDGDNVRHGLCSDLGFSPEDRTENIRRIGEVAKLLAGYGVICVTAFISPYRADRDLVRKIMPEGRFIEVYINAPIEICEARDPKGLYAKARSNQIKNFTGVSAPYEAPDRPELELRTDILGCEECVSSIIEFLNAFAEAWGSNAGRI